MQLKAGVLATLLQVAFLVAICYAQDTGVDCGESSTCGSCTGTGANGLKCVWCQLKETVIVDGEEVNAACVQGAWDGPKDDSNCKSFKWGQCDIPGDALNSNSTYAILGALLGILILALVVLCVCCCCKLCCFSGRPRRRKGDDEEYELSYPVPRMKKDRDSEEDYEQAKKEQLKRLNEASDSQPPPPKAEQPAEDDDDDDSSSGVKTPPPGEYPPPYEGTHFVVRRPDEMPSRNPEADSDEDPPTPPNEPEIPDKPTYTRDSRNNMTMADFDADIRDFSEIEKSLSHISPHEDDDSSRIQHQ